MLDVRRAAVDGGDGLGVGGCLYVGKIEFQAQFWECPALSQCDIVYQCDTLYGGCLCDIPPENCDTIDPGDADYVECTTRSSSWVDACYAWMCPSSLDPLDAYELCANPVQYPVTTQSVSLCYEPNTIDPTVDTLQDSRDWCAQAAAEDLAWLQDIDDRADVGIVQDGGSQTSCFSNDEPFRLSRTDSECPANESFYNRDGSMQVDTKASWLTVTGVSGRLPVYGWLKANWRGDGSLVFLAGELSTAPMVKLPYLTKLKTRPRTIKSAMVWLAQSIEATPTADRNRWVVMDPTVIAEFVDDGVTNKGELTLFNDINVRLVPGSPPRLHLDLTQVNVLTAHIEVPVEESNRRFWNRVIRDR